MKKTGLRFLALCLVIALATACAPAPAAPAEPVTTTAPAAVEPSPTAEPLPTAEPTATPVPTATPAPTDTPEPPPAEPVVEIAGPDQTVQLTLAELQALTVTEGQAGIKSSTGRITIPAPYKGVALKDLVELVGGMDETMGVNVVAEDGYAITFSHDQIQGGDFIVYDPATGNEFDFEDPLSVILAYERDGELLPEKEDGAVRLAIVSPKNNQVTDGHWSVKWVARVEVKSFGEVWNLKVHGAVEGEIDRATFESCGAPGCHGAAWIDDSAQTWSGVPLWLLVGWMDDEIQHEGPAFNDALLEDGYKVIVTAADGYSVALDGQMVARNNGIIVAHQVNSTPLDEENFPLRLVGDELARNERVGAITELGLEFGAPAAQESEAEATEAPAAELPAGLPEPEGEAGLKIFGQVAEVQAFSEEDLRALEVVQVTAEHPKSGQADYEGVRLSELLALARPAAGATKLVFTASDGYAVTADLQAVLDCSDCLLGFTNTPGKFKLVMPGMESAFWVKDIEKIEVQ